MDNGGSLSFDTVDSSFCHACQGLFDMKSPRACVLDRTRSYDPNIFGKPTIESSRYIYVYIHHANAVALLASARAGCSLCTMMCDRAKDITSYVISDAELELAQESDQPNSEACATQSDVDFLAATQFAELVKREGLVSKWGTPWFPGDSPLGKRIILLSYFDEKPGLPLRLGDGRSSRSSTAVHELTWGHLLQHFYIPCMCTSSQGVLYLLASKYYGTDDALDPNLEHRPSKDLLSEAHIGLISRWRHTCETEHESCSTVDPPLPSRILELLDPSDEEYGVRLVETHGKMQGAYVCLSYCWGDLETQLGQTNRSNLLTQQQGIAFSTLPSTIIDAIYLSYKLGFQFIWIDRLCIVQDDEKDWSIEASRMCEVYSRSALTISASICRESSQSFVAERRKGFREQKHFTGVTRTDEESMTRSGSWFSSDFTTDKFLGPWFLEEIWAYFYSVTHHNRQNRWLERGWTFQEWMLSPRVLHIDSMTLWDCFEGYANELSHRDMGKPRLLRSPRELGMGISWYSILQEYSERKITREEDRLPALAGLATSWAVATGHTYLAGLWLEDMPCALLWEPYHVHGCNNTYHSSQNMPSWSWASFNGHVTYLHVWNTGSRALGFVFSPRAFVVSAFCQYNPPSSLSAVEKAWIDIDGRMSVVTEQRIRDGMLMSHMLMAGGEWWNVSQHYGPDRLDDEIDEAKIHLIYLGTDSSHSHALILQFISWDDNRPCFRRLGVARHSCLNEEPAPEVEPSWKAQVVRLI